MADFAAFAAAYGPAILSGVLVTLCLTACGAVLGVGLGVLLAALRLAAPRAAGRPIAVYVEIFRDTPFIVQLFFIFFGLPALGIQLGAFAAATLAITLNLGAYATELMRAGLESLPDGQREASRALGLHPVALFCLVLLPQAFVAVYPALASQVVISMLDTAVVSQIALRDLTFEADLIQSQTFRAFETYLAVTLIYLALSVLLRRLLGSLNLRLARREA